MIGSARAIAELAAREAAEILLEECRRQGGPRGPRGHSPTDEEAERAIRERLGAAFPHWGYFGEETGERNGDGRHVWVVDPNDGTTAMQDGYRGHAISIALLRDRVPVLGVVLAVNAPDDRGDLFSWEEGAGPLTRNGVPIGSFALATELRRDDVVMVSHAADRHPVGNLRCVAPARFYGVPSIAYRLALVAAGEAVAGVSLNAPGAVDYAAGHALVRAQGGVLLNETGEEITYDPRGRSSCTACFGGAPEIAASLARQRWDVAPGSGYGDARPDPGYEPVRLRAGRQVHDVDRLRRSQGCLLGQVAGDSLGQLVEFKSASQIARRFPDGGPRYLADGGTWDLIAGQPTDDSELALALARTIVHRGGFDLEAVAAAYGRWLESSPFDVGNTTRQALSAADRNAISSGQAASRARAAASHQSQANGALMRISPLGISGCRLEPDRLAAMARDDASLTHPHAICQEASALLTGTIAAAIREGLAGAGAYRFALEFVRDNRSSPEIYDRLERAAQGPPAEDEPNGWVLVALQHAFHQLARGVPLEEGVVQTVRAGGDTDTNGAICGALLGAVQGRDAVPAQWRRMVLSCRPLSGHPGVHNPRPATFWPADSLVLAEALLLAGLDGGG